METYSILDRTAPAAAIVPAGEEQIESNAEQVVEQGSGTRTSQASISAAIAAANAGLPTLASPLRFPGEDGGRSLAKMAQHDLDAALQLLADRAQYITGANGAAIALRRSGKNDMQCRASTGANVPELGALFSTEFGLSGESVRTRQPLRCDDAERDPRVNREGCRQLGIASVVVMPVVNDDEVLGVFELFSGRVNAFGERDLSALQRLSEMVETAVRLARAAESIPQIATDAPAVAASGDELDEEILEVETEAPAEFESGNSGAEATIDGEASIAALEALRHPGADHAAANLAESVVNPPEESPAQDSLQGKRDLAEILAEVEDVPTTAAAGVPTVASNPVAPPKASTLEEAAPVAIEPTATKKPLFWSVAMSPAADAEKIAEPDQSHVPPVLRSLRTCEACGFPVSPGRALCVECEEKRWRGQLKRPGTPLPRGASAGAVSKAPLLANSARNGAPTAASPATSANSNGGASEAANSAPVARLMAAAQAAASAAGSSPTRPGASTAELVSTLAAPVVPAVPTATRTEAPKQFPKQPTAEAASSMAETAPASATSVSVPNVSALNPPESQSPDFVLSAGLTPSQSWLAANKYIVGAIVVVAATVAVILFLR